MSLAFAPGADAGVRRHRRPSTKRRGDHMGSWGDVREWRIEAARARDARRALPVPTPSEALWDFFEDTYGFESDWDYDRDCRCCCCTGQC
jgi:hypothetical protein